MSTIIDPHPRNHGLWVQSTVQDLSNIFELEKTSLKLLQTFCDFLVAAGLTALVHVWIYAYVGTWTGDLLRVHQAFVWCQTH